MTYARSSSKFVVVCISRVTWWTAGTGKARDAGRPVETWVCKWYCTLLALFATNKIIDKFSIRALTTHGIFWPVTNHIIFRFCVVETQSSIVRVVTQQATTRYQDHRHGLLLRRPELRVTSRCPVVPVRISHI